MRLGNNNEMKVVGVGTVGLRASCGRMRTIKQVQYVPNLAHNLLSVRQRLGSGFTVLFANGECTIKDEESNSLIVRIEMSKHRLFPLSVDEI